MNAVQQGILGKLRYQSFLSYNALWNKEGDSSKFAYHLRSLENKGFVEKFSRGYKLTLEGVKFSDYKSLASPQPILVVIVVAKRGDKVLVNYREKFPYKGYQEFCASKVTRAETFEEAAENRLFVKLGMTGKVTYKGIEFLQSKENDTVVMHHHLHIFLAEDVVGDPLRGEWVSITDFSPVNPLPHIEQTLKIALGPGFSIAYSDLIKEGDEYTSYVTHKFLEY